MNASITEVPATDQTAEVAVRRSVTAIRADILANREAWGSQLAGSTQCQVHAERGRNLHAELIRALAATAA